MFQLNWYYLGSLVFVVWIVHHFKHASIEQKTTLLKRLALVSVVFYLYNLYFFAQRAHVLTLLPLQLCNLGVLVLYHALKKPTQTLWDFLFYVCGLVALAAILIVNVEYHNSYSLFTLSFYIFHFLIFLIPALYVGWGFHSLTPNRATAAALTVTLIALSLLIHAVNLMLNGFGVPANYFFTLRAHSVEVNPIFAGFARVIPSDYFYMYLVFPILYLYMIFIKVLILFHATHRRRQHRSDAVHD
jgi:uncharacterized membrane protein YwaF